MDHSISVEQLQLVRREQREHLLALPQRRKLAKLASCRHCDVSGCRCPGWIPTGSQDSTAPTTDSEIESVQSSEISVQQSCKTCRHELEEHGCAELDGKPPETIFGLICLSQDVVSLYSSVQNQTDPDAKQIYFYVYKQLRKGLDTLVLPPQPLFKPSPPFETAPSIVRLVANFIHYHIDQIPLEDSHQLATLFLDVFDVWQIPFPGLLLQKLQSKENKEYFQACVIDPDEFLTYYRTFYSQWLCHCRIPAISARLTLPCWRATAIFGQKLLRAVFPLFRDDLIAHCKAEKSQRDLLQKLIRFLNMMQQDFKKIDQDSEWFAASYNLSSFSPKFLDIPALVDSGLQAQQSLNDNKQSLAPQIRKRRGSNSGSTFRDKKSKYDTHGPESRVPGDVPKSVINEILKEFPILNAPHSLLHHTATPHTSNPHHLAVALRDEKARLDYQSGILSVHVANNSPLIQEPTAQSDELSLFLLGAQNIFTAQLPKMPRPYVARLVFDPKHRTLCLVKRIDPSTPVALMSGSNLGQTPSTSQNSQLNTSGLSSGNISRRVIGAICFCAFPERQFSEVVFCAVSAEEQVRGFGTFMMSCLKEWHVRHGYRHLLTYADEFAVGYFLKQGFTSDFALSKSHYEGYIKEYEGATLMACELTPNVSYTHLTIGIRQVRKVVEALAVRKRREVVIRRQGLSCFDDGVCQIPIDSIPGAIEAGFSDDKADKYIDDAELLHSNLRSVLAQVKAHPSSWPFLKPVDKTEAHDYYDVIKWPMDLKTISDRLKSRYYHHRRLFLADFTRMFENCRKYNAPPTEYYKCANTLEKYFLQKMREADLLLNVS